MTKHRHYLWQRIIGEPGPNGVVSGENDGAKSGGNGTKSSKRKREVEPVPHKGDGCRSEAQRQQYPDGRTRLTQLIAHTPLQGMILQWILSHTRSRRGTSDARPTRQTAVWRLLEAGWHALRGDQAVPPSLDVSLENPSSTGDHGGSAAARRPQGDGWQSSPSISPKPEPEGTLS